MDYDVALVQEHACMLSMLLVLVFVLVARHIQLRSDRVLGDKQPFAVQQESYSRLDSQAQTGTA